MSVDDLTAFLKQTPAFSQLSDEDVSALAERFELVHFAIGQTVFRAGDPSDAFYVVFSGRARALGLTPAGDEVTVGTLTRGGSFGEQGLLRDTTRANTVRAADDLALLKLARADFERLVASKPALSDLFSGVIGETAVRNFLKLCTVFFPLSVDEIKSLVGALKPVEFAAGATIIREDDEGDAYYVLGVGAAHVETRAHGAVLARLKPGDGFGELALLTGKPRAASVVADEPATVYRLDKADFDRIVATSPAVRDALISVASGYSRAKIDEGRIANSPASAGETEEVGELPDAANEPEYRPKRARRYPALLQLSELDCGAACLAMVLRYFGKRVSINRLRELANVGSEGASLYGVSEAADTLGFQTRAIHTSYENLTKAELPAIAHWEGYHFIVVYEANLHGVVVADPGVGLRRLTVEEFTKGWTGYLLMLRPTPALDGVQESRTTIGRFLPLFRPYRRLLGEVFVASVVLQLFGLATPIFTQVIVDRALVHKDLNQLNELLLAMVIVAGFQAMTVALRQYLLIHTTRRIDLTMVVAFFDHLMRLPIRYFQDRKVGDIIRRFQDNAKVRNLLAGRALGVGIDAMMIVVYFAMMFAYSVPLTFVALIFLPCYAILALVMTPLMTRQFRQVFEKMAASELTMVEAVSGFETVKATAAERRIRWKLEGLIVRGLNVEFNGAMLNMTIGSIATILQTLTTVVVFWYGARLVIGGSLTLGGLVAFNVLVAMVTRPILNVIDLWHEILDVNTALERLNEVFDTKPEELGDAPGRARLTSLRGAIRFDNVTFRYPSRPDRNVLQNVDIEIPAGSTVALVGRSGAGKSTFANLLLRFYDPTEGRVLIDGTDLRYVALSDLRSQVGVVPQDVFLFSGTIRENIAIGDPEARLEQVVGASMLAGAHEFISDLPLGYDTIIGERGQSLSGGQKQRVAIARALYRHPRILILDEATSALDTESERAIQQNLDAILKDRTTFIIAHRLSTVRNADIILVLDHEVVVEMGNHYSLMEQKGLYFYLNSQQIGG